MACLRWCNSWLDQGLVRHRRGEISRDSPPPAGVPVDIATPSGATSKEVLSTLRLVPQILERKSSMQGSRLRPQVVANLECLLLLPFWITPPRDGRIYFFILPVHKGQSCQHGKLGAGSPTRKEIGSVREAGPSFFGLERSIPAAASFNRNQAAPHGVEG